MQFLGGQTPTVVLLVTSITEKENRSVAEQVVRHLCGSEKRANLHANVANRFYAKGGTDAKRFRIFLFKRENLV